jgi:hypothetical protein
LCWHRAVLGQELSHDNTFELSGGGCGWPIATGVIEDACRHLVKDRMDITGPRWGLIGAEAILKLRAQTGCRRNAGRRRAVVVRVTHHFRAARDVPGSAAGRRKRARSVAVLAASALAGVLVGTWASSTSGIPASPAAPAAPASASHPATVSSPPGAAGAFGQPLLWPQVAVTATGLYVAWQVSRPGSVVRSELARVDAASGRVEAARRLGAAFEQAVWAAGALWVAASTPAAETLLRLNPDTLKLTGRWQVGTGAGQHWAAQVLVVAGGGLWAAGGNRLLHLSLPGGTITASIALPGAASSDLSANAAGTVLVVGEADSGGRGAVQRRDPATGALLASYPMLGVSAPAVAGPTGSAVWISEATGMMGYVQRLDAATMTAEGSACRDGRTTSTCVEGTNDVTARLAGGLLWITQIAGGNARNYCADPVTGQQIAPIELPEPTQDEVLAITPHRIFYASPGPGASQYLRQEATPSACRTR